MNDPNVVNLVGTGSTGTSGVGVLLGSDTFGITVNGKSVVGDDLVIVAAFPTAWPGKVNGTSFTSLSSFAEGGAIARTTETGPEQSLPLGVRRVRNPLQQRGVWICESGDNRHRTDIDDSIGRSEWNNPLRGNHQPGEPARFSTSRLTRKLGSSRFEPVLSPNRDRCLAGHRVGWYRYSVAAQAADLADSRCWSDPGRTCPGSCFVASIKLGSGTVWL